ncbi:hypothetical protein J4Q44_G00023840, partial [Coregonus suidteri]
MGNRVVKERQTRGKGGSGEGGEELRPPGKGKRREARGNRAENYALGQENIGGKGAKTDVGKGGGRVGAAWSRYREGEVAGGSTEQVIKSVISVTNVKGTNRKGNVRENGKVEGIGNGGEEPKVRDGGPGRGRGVTANRDGLGQGDVEPVELKIEKRGRVN